MRVKAGTRVVTRLSIFALCIHQTLITKYISVIICASSANDFMISLGRSGSIEDREREIKSQGQDRTDET